MSTVGLTCYHCGCVLSGGLDTFGSIDEPMCWTCWSEHGCDGGSAVYGFFPGDDPRNFTPDAEVCTPEEITAWKDDCEAWDRGERIPVPPACQERKLSDGTTIHVIVCRYGLGVYYR